MPAPAIAATGLRKSFGGLVVLDGIDLAVAEGTIFALLGPNGAGKTTTVHILSTLLAADGGHARVAGHDTVKDPEAVRAAIGVTGQFSAIDGLLTGEENLILMADLRHLRRRQGRARAAELLEQFDLAGAARQPAARSRMICHIVRRLRGSRPVVGSSRKTICGSPMRVMARSSRRRMPPE